MNKTDFSGSKIEIDNSSDIGIGNISKDTQKLSDDPTSNNITTVVEAYKKSPFSLKVLLTLCLVSLAITALAIKL